MIELLKAYSPMQTIINFILVILAIKGAVDMWDWQAKHFFKTVDGLNKKAKQEEQVNDNSEDIKAIQEELSKINDKISLLMLSDKEDIKSFIIEKHKQYCYEIGWVDEYTLDCLEKRYGHYKSEGGNSFVDDLMRDIRALPKAPPKDG